jgi:hypothetical protein
MLKDQILRGIILFALVGTIVSGPFLLKPYCSKAEDASNPMALHITEQYRHLDYSNPLFVFGKTFPAPAEDVRRSETQDYSTPQPHAFWRSFFCDINGADYTLAVFTVVLALSTIALWQVTRKTLQHGRQTAERQLRSYLTVKASVPQSDDGEIFECQFRIENFGQTPAYDVKISTDAWSDTFPKASSLGHPNFTEDDVPVIMPPRDAITVYFQPLPPANHLPNSEGAIWAAMELSYRDAFGNDHKATAQWHMTAKEMQDSKSRLMVIDAYDEPSS